MILSKQPEYYTSFCLATSMSLKSVHDICLRFFSPPPLTFSSSCLSIGQQRSLTCEMWGKCRTHASLSKRCGVTSRGSPSAMMEVGPNMVQKQAIFCRWDLRCFEEPRQQDLNEFCPQSLHVLEGKSLGAVCACSERVWKRTFSIRMETGSVNSSEADLPPTLWLVGHSLEPWPWPKLPIELI